MQGTKYSKRPGPAGAVGPPVEADPEPPAQPSLHPNLQTAKMWVGIEPAPEYNFASRLRGPGTDLPPRAVCRCHQSTSACTVIFPSAQHRPAAACCLLRFVSVLVEQLC